MGNIRKYRKLKQVWGTYINIGDIRKCGDIHKYRRHTQVWGTYINIGDIHKYGEHT